MKIIVGDVFCSIVNPRGVMDAVAIIRSVCRARPKGFMFTPRYKSGHWDGYISLMPNLSSFPTGLLNLAVRALQDKGYHVELEFNTTQVSIPAVVTPDCLLGIELRDYQVNAANRLLENKRGIARMATNSGKTEVMATCIKAAAVKSMVLVHRKELLYQTQQRFIERGLGDVGIIGDGVNTAKNITIAMIQTLYFNPGLIPNDNALLAIDECHHLSSDQAMDVVYRIPGAYRIGVSGTPLKHDVLADMKLLACTGDVVVNIDNSYLINSGYSAKPKVIIHTLESDVKKHWGMRYQEAYDLLIVNNPARNSLIAELAESVDGVVLILVNNIEHGILLEKDIPYASFVHGSNTMEVRQDVLERMRRGDKGIFIASPIFDEGVDIPSVDCVIIAAGGKSFVRLLQRVGRGLRKKAGDNTLIVYDFLDDTNKYLLDHSKQRIDVYATEKFDIILAEKVRKMSTTDIVRSGTSY